MLYIFRRGRYNACKLVYYAKIFRRSIAGRDDPGAPFRKEGVPSGHALHGSSGFDWLCAE